MADSAPAGFSLRKEGATAFRNALKLATSLALTWGIALVITFKLPRYLGPLALGWYRYGFEYAATLAVFLHFGVDTYISREIPVRPKHASDFFGGVALARVLLMVPLFAFGWWHLGHRLHEEKVAAVLFGFTQVFIVMNLTFQQMLQAASTVGRLAVANVVAKLVWGGGILGAVLLGAPFWVLPVPMLLAEALKAAFLYAATRAAIGLELRVDLGETKKVLRASLPFFLAIAAVYIGASFDVVLLRELVPDTSEEVGWYSAAREIARLSALMMPVLTGVLVPMMSRAMHHDERRFYDLVRRGMEGVCVVSIPFTLLLALGARFAIGLVLRERFLPASDSLEWLAPTFVLSYVNSLLWLALMIMKRSWTITIVSIVGTALLPIFILVAVPLTRDLGDGKTGMGVAMALSARELVNAVVFLAIMGKRAVDGRALAAIAKSLGICCAVVAAHVALAPLGPARLAIDAVLYATLALATRVVRPSDVRELLRLIKNRKQLQADAA
ncbi:MAG: oligosaccharide flippase family protein [Labilithrix sp.]|nr:oligosaccharide flippase family protein [Labilithrix sp.]MCW5811237.1 oligosaccharide flippase family protein [Labilithrix sp.]